MSTFDSITYLARNTPYWGLQRITSREPASTFANKEISVTEGWMHNVKMPSGAGAGVTVYVLESSLNKDFLDIESERLEILEETKFDSSNKTPQTMHGTIVANILGGTTFGTAPKAKIVMVPKPPPSKFPANDPNSRKGLKIAYDLVIEHFKKTRPKYAIVNVSQGTDASTVDDAVDYCDRIQTILDLGILFISAAGNGATRINKETREEYRAYWDLFTQYREHRTKQNITNTFESTARDIFLINKKLETLKNAGTITPEIQGQIEELNKLKEDSNAVADKLNKLKKSEMKIPSGWPGVLSVGASDVFDSCDKQFHGSGVDIYAPGFVIPFITDSTKKTYEYVYTSESKDLKRLQGTSFASPTTSGAVACLISARAAANLPPWTQAQMRDELFASARVIKTGEDFYKILCIVKKLPNKQVAVIAPTKVPVTDTVEDKKKPHGKSKESPL
ncbi:hypothetical protein EG329_003921 [Mollisiaceae sp. DMI_Dod_QoI]|nr:hypothetical protein EG329_003921 [Helotiales sp. DMI_Dod_QoI]